MICWICKRPPSEHVDADFDDDGMCNRTDLQDPREVNKRIDEDTAADHENELYFYLIGPFNDMLSKKSDAELGAVVREYVGESEHGGWEGFSMAEQMVIASLFGDMGRYAALMEPIEPADPLGEHHGRNE